MINLLRKKKIIILIIFYIFLTFQSHSIEKKNNIMLFIPVSLKESFTEVLDLYQTIYKIETQAVYLGTAQLAQQIKNGARPDLFVSANIEWIKYLEDRLLVLNNYRYTLLSNSLVAITNKKNTSADAINSLKDIKNIFLNSGSRISLAMVDAVPAGIYAKEFLKNIGIWNNIKFNVANSPNVRAALGYISRGDLEYGIVYKSDALIENKVKIIYEIDPLLHTKVEYPITILNEKDKTLKLYRFLKTKKALLIFKKWGFIVNND
tara:strand:+ start:890 stop:1678 length:789 start_codon:yes stop_codon:yes gene_type:complete